MEAVVQVTSQEEIEAAVRAGATVVSVVGKDAKDAIELYEHIPDSVRWYPWPFSNPGVRGVCRLKHEAET